MDNLERVVWASTYALYFKESVSKAVVLADESVIHLRKYVEENCNVLHSEDELEMERLEE